MTLRRWVRPDWKGRAECCTAQKKLSEFEIPGTGVGRVKEATR